MSEVNIYYVVPHSMSACDGPGRSAVVFQNEHRRELDRVTAERDSALADVDRLDNTLNALQHRLTVADELCNKLAAQPQGEQVACFEKFARDRCPGVYFGKDASGEYMAADARLVLDFWNAGRRAEQPAPVAVVLPERKHIPDFTQHPLLNKEYAGWNACVDEVKRLNQ